MSDQVSREEFENTVAKLRESIELAIAMSTVASTAIGVVFAQCCDKQRTLALLEDTLARGESTFAFSAISESALSKYKECCSVLIKSLRPEK